MIDGKGVALVGAYERENFGDLLFLLITRRYLSGFSTIATAPFAGEPSPHMTEAIANYAPVLANGTCDAVWVVGGEVGATSLEDAFRMSASDAEYETFQSLSRSKKDAELLKRSGLAWSASPYIPRLSSYPQSHGAYLIINSAGVGAIRNMRWERLEEVKAALKEANYISVRDSWSSDLLTDLGLRHTLAPDLVHSLAVNHPGPEKAAVDLALVQVKERVLARYVPEALAETLARSTTLSNYRIRLFIAGSARGHDSIALYRQVVEAFKRIAPGRQIDISKAVSPSEKVDEIAGAGLWIGTSLHGYIVSMAYGVPRVGLDLEKVATYARTWDEKMPCAVGLDDLDAAADDALGQRDVGLQRARDLGHMAEDSILAGVAVMKDAAPPGERAAERARLAADFERKRRNLLRKAARFVRAVR